MPRDFSPPQHEAMGPASGTPVKPIKGTTSLIWIVEALLKEPERVAHEISQGQRTRTFLALFAVATICLLGYGLLMGTFSGGQQLWAVPLRVTVGTFLSMLICLPSLYILVCISGGRQSFPEVCGLLLRSLTLSALLLVGFGPVAWIFSQSTHAVAFMGFLHYMFWIIGTWFGLRLLATTLSAPGKATPVAIQLWQFIFVAVALQMCTTLRPLVGKYEGPSLQPKQFLALHWLSTLGDEPAHQGVGSR